MYRTNCSYVFGEFKNHSFAVFSRIWSSQAHAIHVCFLQALFGCMPVFIYIEKAWKSSLHLVEEFRGDTEWPNREGRFDLSGFPEICYFQVAGMKSSGVLAFGRSSSPDQSSPSGSRSTKRTFSPLFSTGCDSVIGC